ncbi:PDZ domain-containing protein [Flagellimonas sp. HMM57]|uniref:S41 family peptidase n=1 Tax=unclassified Flagellimonas TaxID=2644544 RepID=UPI0013CFDE46|nr:MULTISPECIES: S41 family peptidase [unclassified Flagellimonas]UII76804.1 PDZ domain-containing protein [Flagellimonas sp. HMM57]
MKVDITNSNLNFSVFFVILFCCITSISLNAQTETKLMHQPALSDTHIAFIYAEDLWIANRDGSNPKRLTIDEGIESSPIFSPDGSMIAFNAEYDGNMDVFIIPSKGGIPKRLTWHPYNDFVRDFTSDGKNVLFASQRNSHTNRYLQLYTIPINGGTTTQLDVPNAFWASYSDNDSHIAYTPIFDAFNQWKHYRGGRISRIWVYNTENHKVDEIPKPSGGSNDTQPQWIGEDVYFRSDRDGEFNLYSYNTVTKSVKKHTDYKDFPVIGPKAHKNAIIYEQAGTLHIFDTASGTDEKLTLTINTDLLELRERYVSGNKYVRSAAVSPSGARAVLDFRGDIVTVPAEKGDVENITQTTGTHEKFPQWSPDGKSIAYFSDASGEYAMHVQNVENGSVRKIELEGTGFYAAINWSPDSKKVCYVDNGRNLYVTDIASKKTTKIAQDDLFVPGDIRELFSDWSFDSNWVAYTKVIATNFEKAYLYSLSENRSYELTDGLSNVTSPVFDPSGKYVYLLASTDAGPLVNWFDQSNTDKVLTTSIYLVTLQTNVMSPLKKQNDIEKGEEKEEPKEKDVPKNKKQKPEAPKTLKIDWKGIENRMIALPVKAGVYSDLTSVKEGELYYISSSFHSPESHLNKFTFDKRESEELLPLNSYQIAAGGKKMFYNNKGAWFVSDVGKKSEEGPINLDAIAVKINPTKEWNNIFYEAWRVNRDYFYDPGMHGADWDAMKVKYEPFIAHAACKQDLYRVMQWMFSELAVGHHRFGSRGDEMNKPEEIPGGLLGANYNVNNNRYQINKIYGGLNWTPDLRSPLTEPGIDIAVGDYIIEVNGKNVVGTDNIYSFFENTANTLVDLKVSKSADGSNAKTFKVTPLATEWAIRNRDWVEGNMKKVHEATNGDVAYVYVPNTATAGFEYFKRYFFPQADKKAIIIDERYNGGGLLADYYIDILKRPEQAYWNFRYGQDLKSPSASIQGPKVMITDETAGSGGDYLPWMFRKFKVGTIVGKRTWGGLVGVLGYPEFIDGGVVTAPNLAFYTKDGYRVENEGVAPDIEVEQLPELVVKGQDPQLEKAIEIVLKQLQENPPKKMERPAYPIRTKS